MSKVGHVKQGVMMKKLIILVLIALAVNGCAVGGHGAAITSNGGLTSACAASCASYEPDGSGCTKFLEGTSNTCIKYVQNMCELEPKNCKND
jgi:hypothetical protein